MHNGYDCNKHYIGSLSLSTVLIHILHIAWNSHFDIPKRDGFRWNKGASPSIRQALSSCAYSHTHVIRLFVSYNLWPQNISVFAANQNQSITSVHSGIWTCLLLIVKQVYVTLTSQFTWIFVSNSLNVTLMLCAITAFTALRYWRTMVKEIL